MLEQFEALQSSLKIPDLWQQEAVRALDAGHDVIVDAPTGAGKTWIFELYTKQARFQNGPNHQAVYTVPTRALANEKWREWKDEGWDVGIATGDRAENIHAPVIVATLETQRERLLQNKGPKLLVVDEYQMIADENRGLNYELALALAPPETQLLCLSGSVDNPDAIQTWLQSLGRSCELIRVKERPVPLDEIPVESLPRAPKQVTGFWPQLAWRALIADLGPLLIFVPRRAGAEKLARKISAALPEDDPIGLPPEHQHLLNKELKTMLARRVAVHHSGLEYAARAGIIEPLAKAGQFRVIVATMGLATGINFSVRSVLVSETQYFDGLLEREVRHDELLQMFGRAGRRGLDEYGYVVTTRSSPGLPDAAPRRLRRINELDWPTLIRVMEQAAAAGETNPFDAVRAFNARLFTKHKIPLGLTTENPSANNESESFLEAGPSEKQFLDSNNTWSPLKNIPSKPHPLSACLVHDEKNESFHPALSSPAFLKTLDRGKPVRIPDSDPSRFGLSRQIARINKDNQVKPMAWFRDWVGDNITPSITDESVEISDDQRTKIQSLLAPATLHSFKTRGRFLYMIVDYHDQPADALIDTHGQALINPPTRAITRTADTSYESNTGAILNPEPGTVAHAWRKLQLVDANGAPTTRGKIFSRFQRGEGLVIAAALEDNQYPPEDLAWHLANIRAGHRFADHDDGDSIRLSAAAREAYGTQSHDGYLETGLCPTYGAGAAEAVRAFLEDHRPIPENAAYGAGDLERTVSEWLSLLRHITHAPDLPDTPRWTELQSAADHLLETHTKSLHLPPPLPQPLITHKLRMRPRW
ncbi:MAG: DEAD/DEAH box helicase [Verrucomicrobiota bacterium]